MQPFPKVEVWLFGEIDGIWFPVVPHITHTIWRRASILDGVWGMAKVLANKNEEYGKWVWPVACFVDALAPAKQYIILYMYIRVYTGRICLYILPSVCPLAWAWVRIADGDLFVNGNIGYLLSNADGRTTFAQRNYCFIGYEKVY